MKEIVLDTETTGLSVRDGHRIVEIGCIELDNLVPTKNIFHVYLNPERKVSEKAFEVHGYTDEFLSTKQKFLEIAKDFLSFIEGKKIIGNSNNVCCFSFYANKTLTTVEGGMITTNSKKTDFYMSLKPSNMISRQFLTMTLNLIIKFRVDPSRRNCFLTFVSKTVKNRYKTILLASRRHQK